MNMQVEKKLGPGLLCGIFAAIKIFSNRFVKITASGLSVLFVVILSFSSLSFLIAIASLIVYFLNQHSMEKWASPRRRMFVKSTSPNRGL